MTSLLAQQATLFSWPAMRHRPPATATGICTISPSLRLFSSKHITYHHGTKSDMHKEQNQIVCMAHPRRVKMVSQQIKRELADMFLRDKVLQQAILPETALGADKYLSSLATISDVVVSGDLQTSEKDLWRLNYLKQLSCFGHVQLLLQVVKVYVSVYGDERGREIAIEGLKSKNKYVRCELGKRIKLRMTPEVRFIEDDSLERGSRVIAILDKLKHESKRKMQRPEESVNDDMDEVLDEDVLPTQSKSNISSEEDWKSDQEDEDIIYIK